MVTTMVSTVDTDDGPVQRCLSHRHIRECFTVEMDRYMAEKETRFLDGTHMCGRDEDEDGHLFPPGCAPLTTTTAAEPHDPRIRIMVDRFMAARMSIPMGFDHDGLPALYPTTASAIASLDAMETARLAMAHKTKACRRAERSHTAVRKAAALAWATMVYVKAVQRLPRPPSACGTLYGLLSAYDTEKRVLLLARRLLRAHQQYKQRAEAVAAAVAERLHTLCKNVLDQDNEHERAAINGDDLTAAAIASHAECLHSAMARESIRIWQLAQQNENQDRERPRAEPAAELLAELRASPPRYTRQKGLMLQQPQQTHDAAEAEADAVHKYIVAERALQAMKAECRAQSMRVPYIHFSIYPARGRGQNALSFHVNMLMYTRIQRNRVKKRW